MLDEDTTEFDIRIKDNFFSKEDFNYIKDVSKKISFDSLQLQYSKKKNHHVFFTTNASKEICDIVYKRVSNFFKIKILDMRLCQYSLVNISNSINSGELIPMLYPYCTVCRNRGYLVIYIGEHAFIHCGTRVYIHSFYSLCSRLENTVG